MFLHTFGFNMHPHKHIFTVILIHINTVYIPVHFSSHISLSRIFKIAIYIRPKGVGIFIIFVKKRNGRLDFGGVMKSVLVREIDLIHLFQIW